MTSCISRCKDTTFNVIEIWECQWDKQLKGEAAKDYKGGHGWDVPARCPRQASNHHAKGVGMVENGKKWYEN